MKETNISPTSLRRFPKYRDVAAVLGGLGWDYITSADLARACAMQEVLVRKDLAQTGVVGRPHYGYSIRDLMDAVVRTLGWDQPLKMIIVGAGKMAAHVAQVSEFAHDNISFVFAIDNDPAKIGGMMGALPVLDYDQAAERIKSEGIKMAALIVPLEVAQSAADKLVELGIVSILNYTPAAIVVPEHVVVEDASVSPQLATLSYWIKPKEDK